MLSAITENYDTAKREVCDELMETTQLLANAIVYLNATKCGNLPDMAALHDAHNERIRYRRPAGRPYYAMAYLQRYKLAFDSYTIVFENAVFNAPAAVAKAKEDLLDAEKELARARRTASAQAIQYAEWFAGEAQKKLNAMQAIAANPSQFLEGVTDAGMQDVVLRARAAVAKTGAMVKDFYRIYESEIVKERKTPEFKRDQDAIERAVLELQTAVLGNWKPEYVSIDNVGRQETVSSRKLRGIGSAGYKKMLGL